MDRTRLKQQIEDAHDGQHVLAPVYETQASFDRVMLEARMPEPYWEGSRGNISFKTFEEKGYEARTDAAPVRYSTASQVDVYDNILSNIKERRFSSLYRGDTLSFSSNPTDNMACHAAALIARTLIRRGTTKIRWQDANEVNRWGRAEMPDLDADPISLLIVTGLHKDPTKELWESVRRWWSWGMKPRGVSGASACVILVGSGLNPIELVRLHYGIEPNYAFFSFGVAKRSSVNA